MDPSGQPPARIKVAVSARDYDRAYDVAQRQGVSVPHLLRTGLRRVLDDPDE